MLLQGPHVVREHSVYTQLQPGAPEPLAVPLLVHVTHNMPISQPYREQSTGGL